MGIGTTSAEGHSWTQTRTQGRLLWNKSIEITYRRGLSRPKAQNDRIERTVLVLSMFDWLKPVCHIILKYESVLLAQRDICSILSNYQNLDCFGNSVAHATNSRKEKENLILQGKV